MRLISFAANIHSVTDNTAMLPMLPPGQGMWVCKSQNNIAYANQTKPTLRSVIQRLLFMPQKLLPNQNKCHSSVSICQAPGNTLPNSNAAMVAAAEAKTGTICRLLMA